MARDSAGSEWAGTEWAGTDTAGSEGAGTEGAGSEAVPGSFCPPQCRLAIRATRDPSREQVDWAGLPVNLDFVFSQNQRDKVYLQHLLRRRDTPTALRLGNSPWVCARGNDCPLGLGRPLARTPHSAGS